MDVSNHDIAPKKGDGANEHAAVATGAGAYHDQQQNQDQIHRPQLPMLAPATTTSAMESRNVHALAQAGPTAQAVVNGKDKPLPPPPSSSSTNPRRPTGLQNRSLTSTSVKRRREEMDGEDEASDEDQRGEDDEARSGWDATKDRTKAMWRQSKRIFKGERAEEVAESNGKDECDEVKEGNEAETAGAGSNDSTTPKPTSGQDEPDSPRTAHQRRREQVRRAQRNHRERKGKYIKQLETELLQLRDSESSVFHQTREMLFENDILRDILSRHGVRIPAEAPHWRPSTSPPTGSQSQQSATQSLSPEDRLPPAVQGQGQGHAQLFNPADCTTVTICGELGADQHLRINVSSAQDAIVYHDTPQESTNPRSSSVAYNPGILDERTPKVTNPVSIEPEAPGGNEADAMETGLKKKSPDSMGLILTDVPLHQDAPQIPLQHGSSSQVPIPPDLQSLSIPQPTTTAPPPTGLPAVTPSMSIPNAPPTSDPTSTQAAVDFIL